MELRKDYILDRYVIIATDRKARPKEFRKEEKSADVKECAFCPGHEYETPPEVGRLKDEKGNWKIRWFNNLFPAAEKKGNPVIRTDNTFFTFSDAYGAHEILVETPEHEKQLGDLSVEQITDLFKVYKDRIIELHKDRNIKYVLVMKNEGREGGASRVHSHSQIIAYNKIPNYVQEEVDAIKKYEHCPYGDIISIEKNSFRRVFENSRFVAFCPYASKFNYEIWVFPKNHTTNITSFEEDDFMALAEIMKKILLKIKELGCSYNYFLHYSPPGENLHFHIEICPRIATWAGFEIGTDDIINSVSPENAAEFYRS